ncbi:MAG: chondroitinase family protein, partial [Oscillospiraceae bacterium]
ASHIFTLETFEKSLGQITDTDTAQAVLDSKTVRYGKQSLKISYNSGLTAQAVLPLPLAITAGEEYLTLWIYGDNSGADLSLTSADLAGTPATTLITTLNFSGWKQITVALPRGTAALHALQMTRTDGTPAVGTLYLDQLTTGNKPITDGDAPTVTLKVSGNGVTATVLDNIDKKIPKENVVLTF